MSARREYILTVRCTAPDCRESAFYRYDTQRDYRDGARRNAGWKCVRHSQPDTVVSADRIIRATMVAVSRTSSYDGSRLPGLFWVDQAKIDDPKASGSGFIHGQGFRAFASDFPEGTRLYITAEVELPEEAVYAAEAVEHDREVSA